MGRLGHTGCTMTFAVIETGGKQYRVAEGDVVRIEKLSDDIEVGNAVTFDKVLLKDDGANTVVGTPYIEGASVVAELTEEGKGKKIAVMRYKSKSRYFKNKGHRQPYMTVKVTAIR